MVKYCQISLSLISILILFPWASSKASDQKPWDAIKEAKCLKCSFGPGFVTTWQGTATKPVSDNFDLEVFISDINFLSDGKARLIANQGSDDVMAIITPSGANFLEMSGAGNLTLITVFSEYISDSTAFPAVWSRHIHLPTGPMPSQYNGTCKVWE